MVIFFTIPLVINIDKNHFVNMSFKVNDGVNKNSNIIYLFQSVKNTWKKSIENILYKKCIVL